MASPFAPSSSFRNVAASPDTTSTTGCALSRNYKARAGNSNPDVRAERDARSGISKVRHAQGNFMTRVAINGLGRIGRATLKILMDTQGLDLVAANDIGTADNIAYLLKYDTVYGRYEKAVEVAADGSCR
jgi:glutamate dehydrogenase/leucine dehydrogenase